MSRIRLPGSRGAHRGGWPFQRSIAMFFLVAGMGLLALAQPEVPFGSQVTHGPRDVDAVALTFDDGLNGRYTLDVARALEDRDATGTFFAVSRTLVGQPEVAATLIDHGHLLASHSADHRNPSLSNDPMYGKLGQAQREFAAVTGKCPRFYRPPHGVRTPMVSLAVSRAGMQLVNWDVEVRDWDATDPRDLANRVLSKIERGSIVLLHDGRDGRPGKDRSVLVQALPLILDGLQARGLRAVRLDELLGTTGYLDHCS